ncbi:MAG: 16S rRNA (cytosine(1402)-N(4))-methyltransferase RsmH [Chloroflexi bacterium]|nr:16S rRNA (cytosine(1402)-N(4))-methyltransferase RsmH [Chloroflexota bacterium]
MSVQARYHEPVMVDTVLHFLQPQDRGRYVDATVGTGGHARAILDASAPSGQLLGLDLDPQALALARERLASYGDRVTLVRSSYTHLTDVLRAQGWLTSGVDGVLADLGLSSLQLDTPERGFSFREDGPLDMRFDPEGDGPTAADLVNTLPEKALADLLWRYGEERRARAIARAIVRHRPIHTTHELAQIVARVTRGAPGRHPATRTFQALRIAVNRELENLERFLPQALDALRPGGRLVIIAFHSLEDRIVKHTFRAWARGCECPPPPLPCDCADAHPRVRILKPFPAWPSDDEVARNPRARSARVRAVEKLAPEEA